MPEEEYRATSVPEGTFHDRPCHICGNPPTILVLRPRPRRPVSFCDGCVGLLSTAIGREARPPEEV